MKGQAAAGALGGGAGGLGGGGAAGGGKPGGTTTPFKPGSLEAMLAQLGNNPANALAYSSYTPGAGQVDPRDTTYWRNVSTLLANTQRAYNEGLLQGQRAATDYETGLSDMRDDRGREQRALAEEMMRMGTSRSGYSVVRDTEDTSDFLRNMEDYQTDYTRDVFDRKAAMQAIIQDYIREEGGEVQSALDRYTEKQQALADEGSPLYDLADQLASEEGDLPPEEEEDLGGGGGGGGGGKGKKGKRSRRQRRRRRRRRQQSGSGDRDRRRRRRR